MRLILFVVSLIALLVIGAMVGPSFIDWNKHKPTVITQVKNATGLDVKIDGNISLALIPTPRVKIEDLTVVAPRKVKFENLLKMKSAEVSVELVPLFSKKIAVDTVTFIEPVIQVEILEDGTPSWETEKIAKLKEVSGTASAQMKAGAAKAAGSALDSVSLNKLDIKSGTLEFYNHKNAASHKAENVDATLKADSLKGPFIAKGDFVYQGKKVSLDTKTGKLPQGGGAMDLQFRLGLPDLGTILAFSGVTSLKQPYDIQGKTALQVNSIQSLAQFVGTDLGSEYNTPLSLDGLLSINEEKISYNDLKISFDKFIGNGKILVKDLKQKNPVSVTGVLESTSILNIEPFLAMKKKSGKGEKGKGLKAAGKSGSGQRGLIPDTLTLPVDANVDFKINVSGLKTNDYAFKGVVLDLAKSGAKAGISFKALEMPGQARTDGILNIVYGSSSKAPKTGEVTYSNPKVDYSVNGQIGQLDTFLKTFAPKVKADNITRLYKTARYKLKGNVAANAISMKDSTLVLDNMVMGVGGRYEVASGDKRAKAVIDVSVDSLDLDKILAPQNAKKTSSQQQNNDDTTKKSAKEALKPVQSLSLPVDLVFDLSSQKVRYNQTDMQGARFTGGLKQQELTLNNASINNIAGAAMVVKGTVKDINSLSGINLQFYTKAPDIRKLGQALKADTTKIPQSIKSLEANITGKGSVQNLGFNANLKTGGGELEASGSASNPLESPEFSNLIARFKHANLVQAIRIFSPEFKGPKGLERPIDFYTKANSRGKLHNLSDIQAKLGDTTFKGDLEINLGKSIPSVKGSLQADDLALGEFLGSKKSSSGSRGSGDGGSGGSSSGERWSKQPINLDWTRKIDVEIILAANSMTYGGWSFIRPSTDLFITTGTIIAKDMRASVFGGKAKVDTQIKSNPVSISLETSMNDIDLESLAKALSGSKKLQSEGTVSFDANVKATGASPHAMINALNGFSSLEGTNVVLKGFDLAKLARGLAVEEKLATSVSSLVDGATKGGETKFDTVNGGFKITNGVANISAMVMDGPAAKIDTTGYADFPKWYVNLDNKITLKEVGDLKPFNVKIKGPLDNPSDTFGKNILEDYVGDKIKRKIGKELPDILGDDVSEKLQKFGIIPKQEAPAKNSIEPQAAPTGEQAPANDNAVPEQQPAEQPVQQQQQPEEIDPEDVVKDVLKGLF